MTVFDFDQRLAPIRSGAFADLATALAWLLGLLATFGHPVGLAVAGSLLGVTASSSERAFAAGAVFGIVVTSAGWLWVLLGGSVPLPVEVPLGLAALVTLLVPPIVASVVRAVG